MLGVVALPLNRFNSAAPMANVPKRPKPEGPSALLGKPALQQQAYSLSMMEVPSQVWRSRIRFSANTDTASSVATLDTEAFVRTGAHSLNECWRQAKTLAGVGNVVAPEHFLLAMLNEYGKDLAEQEASTPMAQSLGVLSDRTIGNRRQPLADWIEDRKTALEASIRGLDADKERQQKRMEKILQRVQTVQHTLRESEGEDAIFLAHEGHALDFIARMAGGVASREALLMKQAMAQYGQGQFVAVDDYLNPGEATGISSAASEYRQPVKLTDMDALAEPGPSFPALHQQVGKLMNTIRHTQGLHSHAPVVVHVDSTLDTTQVTRELVAQWRQALESQQQKQQHGNWLNQPLPDVYQVNLNDYLFTQDLRSYAEGYEALQKTIKDVANRSVEKPLILLRHPDLLARGQDPVGALSQALESLNRDHRVRFLLVLPFELPQATAVRIHPPRLADWEHYLGEAFSQKMQQEDKTLTATPEALRKAVTIASQGVEPIATAALELLLLATHQLALPDATEVTAEHVAKAARALEKSVTLQHPVQSPMPRFYRLDPSKDVPQLLQTLPPPLINQPVRQVQQLLEDYGQRSQLLQEAGLSPSLKTVISCPPGQGTLASVLSAFQDRGHEEVVYLSGKALQGSQPMAVYQLLDNAFKAAIEKSQQVQQTQQAGTSALLPPVIVLVDDLDVMHGGGGGQQQPQPLLFHLFDERLRQLSDDHSARLFVVGLNHQPELQPAIEKGQLVPHADHHLVVHRPTAAERVEVLRALQAQYPPLNNPELDLNEVAGLSGMEGLLADDLKTLAQAAQRMAILQEPTAKETGLVGLSHWKTALEQFRMRRSNDLGFRWN
ncbi:MAG: hypothetical protein SFZ03_01630 [Candidatus Melainabacteria bacterium]|nr:hypothetical protein [Candidatus Melainabacteria bacterium]